jgi:hypothetical protein
VRVLKCERGCPDELLQKCVVANSKKGKHVMRKVLYENIDRKTRDCSISRCSQL